MASLMKTQFNVDLTAVSAKRIRMDAINLGVSLSEYTQKALDLFVSTPVQERRRIMAGTKRKTLGRPVSAVGLFFVLSMVGLYPS